MGEWGNGGPRGKGTGNRRVSIKLQINILETDVDV